MNDALPIGFTYGGLRCGIKQGRPDLGLIRSDRPATAAAVFTRSPARAPSVERDAGLVPSSTVIAILVNSGNANAMTGPEGTRQNTRIAQETAAALGVEASQVLTMSTGVIGVPLPSEQILRALPALIDEATPDPMRFAAAILTTDTGTKVVQVSLQLPGASAPVHLLGIAKGSGMIHPNMATTLGYVCTDAAIAPARLQAMLHRAIDASFNGICVDGDTSTNDAVTVLANGASEVEIEGSQREAAFANALQQVLTSLARQVVLDGEGATRLLEIEVRKAPSAEAARLIARGICRSSLVKCSAFAGQPDWGRVAAAAGQAILEHELAIDATQITIAAQGITLYDPRGPCTEIPEAELDRRMRDPTIRWSIDLGRGTASATALGCDLSYDYVRINADEAQQIEVTPEGTVRRNPGLASYSPRLKHQLLVDGLAYVRRFLGLRMMIYLPPQPTPPDRIDKLGRDLELCLDAGLRPLLVVPSEALAQTLLAQLGSSGHHCASVSRSPSAITRMLDRACLGVLVDEQPSAETIVDLAITLGVQKLICMQAERGLRDANGFVSCLSSEAFLEGLDHDRFTSATPELLELARHAATRGVPALHLIDLRLPHALVGELFTDEGIGSLVTRQAID